MKFSTKGRYATRAMLDLALRYGEGTIMVKDIAARQGVSERYLEQILVSMRVAGLVESVRGSGGGFLLARSPVSITIGEIIRAVEGSTAPVGCVDNPALCNRSEACTMYDVWKDVKTAIDDVLDGISLQNMIERYNRKTEVANLIHG
jgi:Rrf2 family protein